MPRKITLHAWAAKQFDPPPVENTLRIWARSGRIISTPVKIGRTYWVEPTARHLVEVMADNGLVNRLRRGRSLSLNGRLRSSFVKASMFLRFDSTFTKFLCFGSALLAVATTAGAQSFQTLPAPPGEPAAVALRVIREAEHPCPKLARASRLADQTIVAVCTNRESYRVFSIRNKAGRVMDLAMKCSAAKQLGISGAC